MTIMKAMVGKLVKTLWKIGKQQSEHGNVANTENLILKRNSKEDTINVVKELMNEYADEQSTKDNCCTIDVTDSVVYWYDKGTYETICQ